MMRDNVNLRDDINDIQNLFANIMSQLDRLETGAPEQRKSTAMLRARQQKQTASRADDNHAAIMNTTYVVHPDSPVVNGIRSGVSSLNASEDGYRRFEPGMCSTYVQSTNTSVVDDRDDDELDADELLETSSASSSLLDYS